MDQKVFWLRPVYLENSTLFQELRLGIYRLGKPFDLGKK
jgi:hypothetical protein